MLLFMHNDISTASRVVFSEELLDELHAR